MSFDLENFPTSETARRMLTRVSPTYNKSYVGKWLFQVMGMEMDEARAYMSELRLQLFPETATWGIVYWEQRYGITPDESMDIEVRRQNVITAQQERAPMNPERVAQIISRMCGQEVKIIENVAPYTFSVDIYQDGTGIDYSGVIKLLNRIKPSHQKYILEYVVAPRGEATIYSGAAVSCIYMSISAEVKNYGMG